MAKKLHAIDYLAKPEKYPPKSICAIYGDEPFLRRQALIVLRDTVLQEDEADFSFSEFEGGHAEFVDVFEELNTLAMFGGDKRVAFVSDADDFVSRYRDRLEDLVADPPAAGVLILDLKSFPANTRLHKAVAAGGLAIDCSTPRPATLLRWLGNWARQTHRVELSQTAAEMLLETIGPELGLLDQELAKLSLSAGEDKKISPELIRQSVGGWRTRTTWEMLDAVLAGDACGAMVQLDRLLAAGESPIGILGQISATLRRLAAATRLILQAEAKGRRRPLRSALEEAGIRSFVLAKAEGQLRHLGRQRAGELYRLLIEADLDLKGSSALVPRLLLERLIMRLAASREAISP